MVMGNALSWHILSLEQVPRTKFSAAGKNAISLIEPGSRLLPVCVYFIVNSNKCQLAARTMRNKNTTGVD